MTYAQQLLTVITQEHRQLSIEEMMTILNLPHHKTVHVIAGIKNLIKNNKIKQIHVANETRLYLGHIYELC
jgi:hypothetical protein